jgi:hypothetical protein
MVAAMVVKPQKEWAKSRIMIFNAIGKVAAAI